jgi:hypothetical protein
MGEDFVELEWISSSLKQNLVKTQDFFVVEWRFLLIINKGLWLGEDSQEINENGNWFSGVLIGGDIIVLLFFRRINNFMVHKNNER